jgi:catechol 2,3-dioxygenase-like lactoylglutathione lyase family enzyme
MLPLSLDHLVIAIRDLDLASQNYQRLLGREPSWTGRHPTYGTANVLFRIDNCYIELLAPTDQSEQSPWNRELTGRLDTAGEGLYAIALGTDNIQTSVEEIREGGIHIDDAAAGDGVDGETGARREWANARMPVKETRGVPAFVIEHRSPADALPVAPSTSTAGTAVHAVDHVVVASSNMPEALRFWQETLGLDLRLTLDRNGRSLHFLLMGQAILELAGETEPAQPGDSDMFGGVAYRVKDVPATVERLRAAGVEISDARDGNAPDTVVADLKPGFSHDVRTLFIQKDVK